MVLVGFGMAISFLPLYLSDLGVTDPADTALWSGILIGTGSVAGIFTAPVWGAAADRFGRKLMLLRAMLGSAVPVALMAFAGDVWQLAGLRVVHGALTGAPAAASALVAATNPPRLGYALGVIAAAVQVGIMLGPAAGGVAIAVLGFKATFLVGAGLLACSGLLVAMLVVEPVADRRSHTPATEARLRQLVGPFGWTGFRAVLGLQMANQLVLAATLTIVPLYVRELSRPESLSAEAATGLALSLAAAATALAAPLVGRWVDRAGPEPALRAGLMGLAVTLIPQGLVESVWAFVVLRAAMGVALAAVVAAVSVMTRLRAPVASEGRAYGAFAAAQQSGWALGPLLAGLIAAALGTGAPFVAAGLGVAMLYLVRYGRPQHGAAA